MRTDSAAAGSDEATRCLKAGDPNPPDEVAIDGLSYRFLLGRPTPEQIGLRRSRGVRRIVKFRTRDEHKSYDEARRRPRGPPRWPGLVESVGRVGIVEIVGLAAMRQAV